MQRTSRTRALVQVGLSIALIAVGAFITVPFGPVPFTLHTLMLGIVICLLPPWYSVAAVGGYLALGMLGLPVFSGFRGGIGVLAGPTGGYLIGFLVAMVLIAFLRSRLLAQSNSMSHAQENIQNDTHHGTERARQKAGAFNSQCSTEGRGGWFLSAVDGGSLLLFMIIYNCFGCAWFMVSTGATLEATLVACLVPFIIPDLIKSAVAFVCARSVRAALRHSFVLAR